MRKRLLDWFEPRNAAQELVLMGALLGIASLPVAFIFGASVVLHAVSLPMGLWLAGAWLWITGRADGD